MAPPPEYDKEPKAPDKSVSSLSCEETKALHNLVNDQQTNSDSKSASSAANDVENNKHVETLDDGQLRALLDEAITYKCPKDREGKSSLFKELLEEVEQDEQACEAAARGLSARGARPGVTRTRRTNNLPHSNSLQDLVAALAAEPAPPHRKHRPAPAPAPVSTRAIHGGSLPSGVDTSFLLGEEPPRGSGAGYLATVRCVNPPPLNERRVSASDANCVAEVELLNRRVSPACGFPMTYTARATLEIGSGAVSTTRATTTTTASNQVRTHRPRTHRTGLPDHPHRRRTFPPNSQLDKSEEKLHSSSSSQSLEKSNIDDLDPKQFKLLSALLVSNKNSGGGKAKEKSKADKRRQQKSKKKDVIVKQNTETDAVIANSEKTERKKELSTADSKIWYDNVNNWYEGLQNYWTLPAYRKEPDPVQSSLTEDNFDKDIYEEDEYEMYQSFSPKSSSLSSDEKYPAKTSCNTCLQNIAVRKSDYNWTEFYPKSDKTKSSSVKASENTSGNIVKESEKNLEVVVELLEKPLEKGVKVLENPLEKVVKIAQKPHDKAIKVSKKPLVKVSKLLEKPCANFQPKTLCNEAFYGRPAYRKRNPYNQNLYLVQNNYSTGFNSYSYQIERSRQGYRARVEYLKSEENLVNPRNVRRMTIGKPLLNFDDETTEENCLPSVETKRDIDLKKTSDVLEDKSTEESTPLEPQNNSILSDDNDGLFSVHAKTTEENEVVDETETYFDCDNYDNSVVSQSDLPKDTEKDDKLESNCDFISEVDINVVNVDTGVTFNESVRSSTPINEPNDSTVMQKTDPEIDVKEVETVSSIFEDDNLKSEVSIPIQEDNAECDKGTVNIPVDSHIIDVEEDFKFWDFSACSRDDDASSGVELVDMSSKREEKIMNTSNHSRNSSVNNENDVEQEVASHSFEQKDNLDLLGVSSECRDETSQYFASLQEFLQNFDYSSLVDSDEEHSIVRFIENSEKVQSDDEIQQLKCVNECEELSKEESHSIIVKNEHEQTEAECLVSVVAEPPITVGEKANDDQCDSAMLSNNAFVLLTLPQHLLSRISYSDIVQPQIENNNTVLYVTGGKAKSKKKKDLAVENPKKKEAMNKNALRAILFENLFKNSADKSISKGLSTIIEREVDTAIPFSCITTPEVVASCNTTSSTSQAVAVDPKPLQLDSSYQAVSSVTGVTMGITAAPITPVTLIDPITPVTFAQMPQLHANHTATLFHPRSVISSSFNGLPLSRPNYGSTSNTTQDEYKKSIDENGNSVQGFSSPLSGSSQQKKPRRKKSSKNETVIKSHQIDGYQGNKDLNEVLRFIESNADSSRAHKLGRAKHKDDSDEKGGKKRSTERRKEKESKMKRATSMEELSRTKLEDLTDKPSKKERRADGNAPAKAERRSWGDDARDSFYYETAEVPADADFQTVTKKRKARRRADEACEPPRARPSSRPRRVSAPPSDRSDSNDDLDSVHSLPPARPAPAPAPAPVSYADIARTRHNIPDLIESCNFYAEGETRVATGFPYGVGSLEAGGGGAPGCAEGYPALEPRAARRLPRDNKPAPPPPRHNRKVCPERTEVANTVECPAPDVVSDRRPPVILLDSSARPGDMDGVTFGFDINEQLLGGGARRPRCDLVRDAIDHAVDTPSPPHSQNNADTHTQTHKEGADGVVPPVAVSVESGAVADGVSAVVAEAEAEAEAGAEADELAVVVGLGRRALRYRPPQPATHKHLAQIIDYVGTAWDDIIRCGSGKVRYFTE